MSGSPLVDRLRERILPADGGTADSWKHHWNLVPYDSAMHKEAADALERAEAVIAAADGMRSWAGGCCNDVDVVKAYDTARAAMGERASG